MNNLTTYTELAEVLDQLPVLVKAERRRRGVSLRDLGRECGFSTAVGFRIEKGGGITVRTAAALLRWLDGAA